MSDVLADLNPRQLEAVTAPYGPLLVLAGPGSGKTRIITRRAAWLIVEDPRQGAKRGVPPAQILCITFTNKAAEEMRRRLEELLGDAARDVWVHTFHAACARILRRHAAAIGLSPHFTVADEQMQSDLLRALVQRRGLSLEEYPPYRLSDFISQFKRELQDPGEAGPDVEGGITPAMIDLAADYGAALRARGLLDFDDLIGQAVRLLAEERGVRMALQRSLPHVLVDEYQDINRAQFEFLRLLAPPDHDVLAVADDAQSIYGWRGAQPGLIGAFRRHYHPRIVELDQSYRSTEAILYAAQSMIRRGDPPERERRTLKTDRGEGTPIYHYIFATNRQEESWLVRLIRKLVAERGYSYDQIAILYRTHRLADELEGALLQAGIPVARVRKESFFEEPQVREVIRYLHLVRSLTSDDPSTGSLASSGQDGAGQAFLAAFNFPQTLADELTVLQLQRLADVHSLSLAELARQGDSFPELSPLTRAHLAAFMRLFDERLTPQADQPAAAVVEALFDVLAQRRSPFTAEEYRLLREAAAFLRFADPATALRDHLAAHGRATLIAPATADGACAAAILDQAVARYLGGVLDTKLTAVNFLLPEMAGQDVTAVNSADLQLQIMLDPATLPLIVKPPRGSLPYSLSAVAWRLAQDLLVSHEALENGALVVYDLETTGTDVQRDEIVEIGAQRLSGGQPTGTPFYSLVRPSRGIPLTATRVHGIRPADVRDAEPIAAVLPRFLRYVGAATVVGHNVIAFDNRLIDRETGRLHHRGFPNPAVDTLEMARRLYKEDPDAPGSFSLEALLQHFGLAEKVQHKAGADVGQTILLFQYLLRENALQLALRALPEYLPLVAVGMAAAGVPLKDENTALWRGGQRMAARLGELPGLHAARTLLDSFGQQALDAAAAALLAAPQPADDPAWVELCNRFRDQVQIFDHFAADHSLNAFLDYQALVTGADTVRQERLAGKVNLMTLHNAKGTEYPVVIIIGLEEENLPLWTTLKRGDFLLEERRVFYVGMTRAKQQLYLTSVRQRGDGFTRIASRFAFELPARYVRRYRVGERGEVREVE